MSTLKALILAPVVTIAAFTFLILIAKYPLLLLASMFSLVVFLVFISLKMW